MKDGMWIRGSWKWVVLEVAKDNIGEIWVCGRERCKEGEECGVKGTTVVLVRCVGSLKSIDVDDSKGLLWAESEGGSLNASITMGAMGRAVEWHDGGSAKDGDGALSEECSETIFGEVAIKIRMSRMCGVCEMSVRFLESEDVKVVGASKGGGTLRGVVKTLIPRRGTKEER